MRKGRSRFLAMLLSGVMVFTSTGIEAAAKEEQESAYDYVKTVETEETTQEDESTSETSAVIESEEEAEDSMEVSSVEEETTQAVTETTESEETSTEETTTVEETSAEEISTEETATVEETSTEEEAVTETIVEEETTTEETTTEEETLTEEETTTEEQTEEMLLPGIENYTLSAEQKASMAELNSYLSDISDMTEGVDFTERELVFLADTEEEALKIAAGYGGSLESFRYGVGVVTLAEEVSVVEALTFAAQHSEDVVLAPAWPNYYRHTYSEDSYVDIDTLDTSAVEAMSYYSDPMLSQSSNYYQWQHTMVGSEYAWRAGYKGKGVTVAVLDTGVRAHNDLNISVSENFVSSESTSDDLQGHGTHVAGLVAAKLNGVGGAGIAPEATLANLRVLNADGSGTDSDIMAAINRAVALKVDIINMSLGGPGYSSAFNTVIERAYNAGVTVFAAAGNEASRAKSYPACYEGAYAVGAVYQDTGRTYFSNYGSWVKFSAPGWELWSTSNSGNYEVMSGTSQATPVIAGTAAVLISADSSIKNLSGSERVDAVIAAMEKGAMSSKGNAAKLVSLTKALGLATSTEKPKAPVFSIANKQTIEKERETLTITANAADYDIYYTLNGKNPTYKNGLAGDGTFKYTGAITIGNASKVTVKAIAVNAVGEAGPVASATYNFKPVASAIVVSGQNVVLKGKSIKLQVEVYPASAANKKLVWKSSDPNAVSAKNGTVKAAKNAAAGTYTITVTSADEKSTAKATFKVTVTDTARVKKISFKPAKATETIVSSVETIDLKNYLNVTLTDKTEGSASDVTWSSSNTKIATVANGVVSKLSAGTVKITATANDGSGVKAVFNLTIKQQATGIELSGYNKLAAGKKLKLTAKVLPANAAKTQLVWTVSPADAGVKVSNGTVTATAGTSGNYTITATSKTDENVKDSFTVTVTDNAIGRITLSEKNATIFRTKGSGNAPMSVELGYEIQSKAANTNIEFTSSNPGIAKVTSWGNGKVTIAATGAATGTTKITCKALDGSGKSAVCTVKVVNPTTKLSIVLPSDKCEYIGKGSKVKLTANWESADGKIAKSKVKWESSDESIVSVDQNGNVKALVDYMQPATITATALDGSGATAEIKVYSCTNFRTLALEANLNRYYLEAGKQYGVDYLFDGLPWYHYGQCPYIAVEVGDNEVINVVPQFNGSYIVIEACKPGKTKLTIKAMDGSNKKVSYNVEVR